MMDIMDNGLGGILDFEWMLFLSKYTCGYSPSLTHAHLAPRIFLCWVPVWECQGPSLLGLDIFWDGGRVERRFQRSDAKPPVVGQTSIGPCISLWAATHFFAADQLPGRGSMMTSALMKSRTNTGGCGRAFHNGSTINPAIGVVNQLQSAKSRNFMPLFAIWTSIFLLEKWWNTTKKIPDGLGVRTRDWLGRDDAWPFSRASQSHLSFSSCGFSTFPKQNSFDWKTTNRNLADDSSA